MDIPRLVTAFYSERPDPAVRAQRVAFGTSGHRGVSFDGTFNERHVAAISQAICVHRRSKGISGPLFLGFVGRAAWKDAIIGGLHMGVRAENGGDFAIEIPTHGQLFGGGFGVHVEDDYLDVRREFGEFAFEGAKRIIDRDHEGSALGIEHGIFHAIFGRPDKDASARRAGGKIGGAKQTRLVRKIFHDFAAVPNVVAAGEDFNAQAEQFLSNPRSDAEARGGILAIGDAKIDLALGENVRQALANDASAGRADNVTDEKNVHSFNLVQATQETGEKRSRLLRRALLGPEPHE